MTPAVRDPAIRAILGRPFEEQLAFFRQKLGNLIPTARWDDIWKAQHDKGFMVAGAQKADLLADLAAAVDRSIVGGTLDDFRKDFDAIVEKHGWAYTGARNWRTRTIYKTNTATAYAAGRLAQLRDGNFPFWMYKHGGSTDPRPQHLAWDGLVLPPDHPFWSTHAPPNGWGCSCRIVGVRTRDAARRLGGDPDKVLPEGWDTIDEATGEPVGIDRGWGYQPGASVVDDVRQFAAKAQRWDYALAKNYMQDVPDGMRDALAKAYRELPSLADDLERYAADPKPYQTLGLLTEEQLKTYQQAAKLTVKRRSDFSIDDSAIHHIRKRHYDDAVERARSPRQRAVTDADFRQLPQLIDAPDLVEDGRLSITKRPQVKLTKKIGSETFVAIFEWRSGRETLALQTLYVQI
jgi:hypothetical protein